MKHVTFEIDYSLGCHTDQQKLIDSASPEEGAGQTAGTQTVEAWLCVLIDGEKFPQSIHGLKGCINCPGSMQLPDKAVAHQSVEPNPS